MISDYDSLDKLMKKEEENDLRNRRSMLVLQNVFQNKTNLLEEQKCDKKIVNPKPSSDLKARNFIIKEPLAKVFSSEFCEIFKKTFFTELLRIYMTILRFTV